MTSQSKVLVLVLSERIARPSLNEMTKMRQGAARRVLVTDLNTTPRPAEPPFASCRKGYPLHRG